MKVISFQILGQYEMSEAQWIKLLHDNKKMETQQEIDNFKQGVEKLRVSPIYEGLAAQLLQVFTDETHHKEVMWSLVHMVESLNLGRYIGVLTKSTSDMRKVAPNWLETLYTSVLNTPDARVYLKLVIKELSDDDYTSVKDFLLQMVDWIEQEEGEELGEIFRIRINTILLGN